MDSLVNHQEDETSDTSGKLVLCASHYSQGERAYKKKLLSRTILNYNTIQPLFGSITLCFYISSQYLSFSATGKNEMLL
jgi:hypothetical protein